MITVDTQLSTHLSIAAAITAVQGSPFQFHQHKFACNDEQHRS